MKKSTFERFISKYNLSGAGFDAVTWKSDATGLSTKFVSDDKHVIGHVSTPDITLDAGTYSISETPVLRALIGVLDEVIDVKVQTVQTKSVALNFKDATTKVSFVLSDAANIPGVPVIKQMPDFNVVFKFDKTLMDRFIRAKGALSDVDTFTVMSDGTKVDIVLGYSKNNTNRVTIGVVPELTEKITPIDFSARYMKEIFVANKEAESGKLEISTDGLSRVTFEISDFTVLYYLPEVKRED